MSFDVIMLQPDVLDFFRAPYKLIFTVVVQVGELDETPALPLVEDGKQKVVEDAVLDVWEFSVDESLLQEEAHQGGLVVRVSQGSQTLEDAGDAQVVMPVTVGEGDIDYLDGSTASSDRWG